MKWKISLILIAVLSACTTYENPYSIEREVDEAYSEWQAEQGISNWEIEKSAHQDNLWAEQQLEQYESYDSNVPSSSDNQIVPSGFSASYAGQYKVVKVNRAYCDYRPDVSGQPTFCNDRLYPNHDFTLVVWGQNWEGFDGSCLLVSGEISVYDGKAQIVALSKSQVGYCE